MPGRPLGLLACRYHGFNQPQPIGTLARSAALPAAEIARELNATPRPKNASVPFCPADFGEKYVLYFSYAAGNPLVVRIDHGGCMYVTNGDLTLPFASATAVRRLEAALGQDPQ